MKSSAIEAKKELKRLADPIRAELLQRFFQTGPGQYGEGDIFLGLTVPKTRQVTKQFSDLPLTEVEKLLQSKIHEERLLALLILIKQFSKADQKKSVLLAIAILLLTASTASATTTPTNTKAWGIMTIAEKMSCATSSIEKRETAYLGAIETYRTAMTSAVTARKEALKAAWSNTSSVARTSAIAAANRAFNSAQINSSKVFLTANTSIAQTGRVDLARCGVRENGTIVGAAGSSVSEPRPIANPSEGRAKPSNPSGNSAGNNAINSAISSGLSNLVTGLVGSLTGINIGGGNDNASFSIKITKPAEVNGVRALASQSASSLNVIEAVVTNTDQQSPVTRVEFYDGNNLLSTINGTKSDGIYTLRIGSVGLGGTTLTPNLGTGLTHTITAKAYKSAGQSVFSAPIKVTVR